MEDNTDCSTDMDLLNSGNGDLNTPITSGSSREYKTNPLETPDQEEFDLIQEIDFGTWDMPFAFEFLFGKANTFA